MSEVAALLGRVVASKFKIEDHVGSGAMGEVFRARHVILDTVVALKVMRADIAKDAMFKERFYREAKAASRLEHPNSVRVLDFGVEPDGLVYLAMEFLHGRDLLSVLRDEWPLPDERIVDILVQTLGAVAMAHQLGIVHRDLKPENIMVSVVTDEDGAQPYHVKVCDFGIAKLNDPRGFQTEGGKPLTSSGTLIGTPEYMSPEQARGDALDARSDVYSVGVILYQLLVGRVPFTAENALGVVLKQVMDAPVAPTTVRPGVNPRLEAICLRALMKPREDRYQTAKEMRRDLRNALAYRSGGIEESDPHLPAVRPPPSDPDIGAAASTLVLRDVATAPTAQLHDVERKEHVVPASVSASGPSPVSGPSSVPDFAPKQTTGGTELTVATPPRRRLGAYVALAALLVGAVAASVIVLVQRPWGSAPTKEATSAGVTAAAASVASGPSTASGTQPPGPAASELPTSPASATAQASGAALPVTSTVAGKASPSASGRHAAAAQAKGSSGALAATATPSAAVTAAAPASAAVAASGPPFNPVSAHVTLGGLTCMRVQNAVIARRMSELVPRLSQCYRDELMVLGKPLGGSAEINLSIDDKGNVTPFVNSPQHPGFSRCATSVFVGQKVAVSALVGDGNQGATVAQWLTLQP